MHCAKSIYLAEKLMPYHQMKLRELTLPLAALKLHSSERQRVRYFAYVDIYVLASFFGSASEFEEARWKVYLTHNMFPRVLLCSLSPEMSKNRRDSHLSGAVSAPSLGGLGCTRGLLRLRPLFCTTLQRGTHVHLQQFYVVVLSCERTCFKIKDYITLKSDASKNKTK